VLDFKAKMNQIRFWALPQAPLGSLQRSSRPLSWISAVLLLRGGRRREVEEGKEGMWEGGE